jgi:molecular chaperone DnaK
MADNELNPVLGIDLGTTFSAIARWHENRREPRHYQHSQSGDTLQSVVYCDPETSEILVGKLAYKKGFMYPENVAVGVKRMMDDASQIISIGGQNFSPIDLSAKILRELYQDITKQFGSGKFKSRGTVVAVPYYFKAHQCEHTRKAAAIADINCLGLIQEPIAASLAYAWQLVQDRPDKEIKENILVFDLGGGTFDLALFCLHQTPNKLLFDVLATGGDDRLGGMDFDECLYNLILKKGDVSLAGLSDIEQKKARQKIIELATEAKITLSAALDTYVTATDVIAGKHIDIKVTRAEFEKSIEVYIKQIDQIIQKVWTISNLRPSDIDRVILVGGSSRIPCVRSLICNLIGEEKVYANINSSLCVAEGAAIYAAYLDDSSIFGREIEVYSSDFPDRIIKENSQLRLEIATLNESLEKLKESAKDSQLRLEIASDKIIKENSQLRLEIATLNERLEKLAGLVVSPKEPVAAALAHYLYGNPDLTYLIYHLGGNTFDVSILRVDSTDEGLVSFKILDKAAIQKLGGDDFDFKIMKIAAAKFQASSEIDIFDLKKDQDVSRNVLREAQYKLWEKAEVAKYELSQSQKALIEIPSLLKDWEGKVHNLEVEIDRSEFNEAIRPLLLQSNEAVESAIAAAKLTIEDIWAIILVGGSTRIPLVCEMIKEHFHTPIFSLKQLGRVGGSRRLIHRDDYMRWISKLSAPNSILYYEPF